MAQMYFKEWCAWLKEEKEVAKLADQQVQEEERAKAHMREELERQDREEKRLHSVRAAIARLSTEQTSILLRAFWSSWIEFTEKRRQEQALQKASLEHAAEKR